MEKLDKFPIHNLDEERCFDLKNYGIEIRSKNNLSTSECNFKQSFDLMKLQKPLHAIQVICACY